MEGPGVGGFGADGSGPDGFNFSTEKLFSFRSRLDSTVNETVVESAARVSVPESVPVPAAGLSLLHLMEAFGSSALMEICTDEVSESTKNARFPLDKEPVLCADFPFAVTEGVETEVFPATVTERV